MFDATNINLLTWRVTDSFNFFVRLTDEEADELFYVVTKAQDGEYTFNSVPCVREGKPCVRFQIGHHSLTFRHDCLWRAISQIT